MNLKLMLFQLPRETGILLTLQGKKKQLLKEVQHITHQRKLFFCTALKTLLFTDNFTDKPFPVENKSIKIL